MRRIKKDDMVKIIAGKDNGKQGKVLSFDPATNKVVVEGCNMVTKHQKPSQVNPQGGILHKEAPIDASNVMLVCPKCGKATRVSHKVTTVTNDAGKQVRRMIRGCKKCGAEID